MKKRKIIPCLLAGALLLSIHSTSRAALVNDTDEFERIINDEGTQMYIPFESTTYKSRATKALGNIFSAISENNENISVGSSYIPSFKNSVTVKNQASSGTDTNECWANSFASAFEVFNYANNTSDKGEEYSARHINLWCNTNFSDGQRTTGRFDRDAVDALGDNFFLASTYAVSGNGPVLESDYPSTGAVVPKTFASLTTAHGQQKELNGYTEYKRKVKYKIIPFVW